MGAFGAQASLHVESTPAAAVYLDGVYRGATPLTVPDVAAGKHALRLARRGYRTHQQVVDSGSERSVAATLEAIPTCTLTVRSTPGGAAIYLDGERMGRTPRRFSDLQPGLHHVELVKTNCLPVSRTVELVPDAPQELALALENRQERAYRAALEADPYDIAAYNDLGELLYVLERYEDAAAVYVEGFIRASEPHEFSERARKNIGRLTKEARRKHGDPAFRKALDLAVMDAMRRGEMGRHLLEDFEQVQHGQYGSAYREAMDTVIAKHPDDADLILRLAPHYRKLGDTERLVALLDQAAEAHARDASVRLRVVDQALDLFEHAKREDVLRKAIERHLARARALGPGGGEENRLRFQEGRFAFLKGGIEDGAKRIHAAIDAEKNHSRAHEWRLWLARQWKQQKKYAEAAELLQAILKSKHRPHHIYHQARNLHRALPKEFR